ncbi:hypothetical protein L596_001383 [Steinernema carpocapsae]|uniref:Uncharacterized protein n=1 Tax=Steinernema carpocapsae TaxID=34508 RepID=A0A4U8ULL9_STECR|nr:hypothetical protein L596_001383 [Steinernema carpocapsae]
MLRTANRFAPPRRLCRTAAPQNRLGPLGLVSAIPKKKTLLEYPRLHLGPMKKALGGFATSLLQLHFVLFSVASPPRSFALNCAVFFAYTAASERLRRPNGLGPSGLVIGGFAASWNFSSVASPP